jgi:hypothetical protein
VDLETDARSDRGGVGNHSLEQQGRDREVRLRDSRRGEPPIHLCGSSLALGALALGGKGPCGMARPWRATLIGGVVVVPTTVPATASRLASAMVDAAGTKSLSFPQMAACTLKLRELLDKRLSLWEFSGAAAFSTGAPASEREKGVR